jgi:hypothetical protein
MGTIKSCRFCNFCKVVINEDDTASLICRKRPKYFKTQLVEKNWDYSLIAENCKAFEWDRKYFTKNGDIK